MKAKLMPSNVLKLQPPEGKDREVYWDSNTPGFGLVVLASGARSYCGQYRNALGQSRRKSWPARVTLGGAGLSLDEARKEFRKLVGDVARGGDPVEERREVRRHKEAERQREAAATATTLRAVIEAYLRRECGMTRGEDGTASFPAGHRLRTGPVRLAVFERCVYPHPIADRQIADIKRSELRALLDSVEDARGPAAAGTLLQFLSIVFNWRGARDDDFRSPIARGMAKASPARDRVLGDDELRILWQALDLVPDHVGRFARFLLLTGLRRNEAVRTAWHEISPVARAGVDEWAGPVLTVPAVRMKGKRDHAVPIVGAVRAVIGEPPVDARHRPYVFSGSGGLTVATGYGRIKAAIDEAVTRVHGEPLPRWTFHDLRRTAKTLMQRAGVRPDISERVLAHTIGGVEGVYDRYGYLPEKADALERLAGLVERIAGVNVVVLKSKHR